MQAAKKARDEIGERDIPIGARGDYDFHTETQELRNDTLRNSVLDGVAFHHAGLSKNDRDRVEEWFKQGKIQLLFSTSTLAWGVNLPARCVVLRDTKLHDPLEGEVDMSPLDVLQMLGRAGRPGYDDVGYGWVVCDFEDADKYRKLLRDGKEIESRLAEDLDSHLNAEIAMGTISDLDDVMSWLRTTFYYVRAQSKPDEYDFENHRERVRNTLQRLVSRGFVEQGDDLKIEGTALAVLASKFYLNLDTAERFRRLAETEEIDASKILEAVAGAAEFDSVSSRQSERDAINSVLVGQDSGDLEAGGRKVLAILAVQHDGVDAGRPPERRVGHPAERGPAVRGAPGVPEATRQAVRREPRHPNRGPRGERRGEERRRPHRNRRRGCGESEQTGDGGPRNARRRVRSGRRRTRRCGPHRRRRRTGRSERPETPRRRSRVGVVPDPNRLAAKTTCAKSRCEITGRASRPPST